MDRSKRPQGGCMLHVGDNLLPFFHSYTCNNSNICKKDGQLLTASFPCNICSTRSISHFIPQYYTSYKITHCKGEIKMDGFLAVLDTGIGNRTRNRRYGIEYSGPCPWCGGTDRFHVWPDARHLPGIGTLGWYRCMGPKVGRRGCDRKGDGITYLEEYRGMSFREACGLLGIDSDALLAYRRREQGSSPSLPPAIQRCARELSPADRSTLWQEQAALIARLAHRCLCSERGKDARFYLEVRGLDESIVHAAHLGYCRAYARL